MPQLFLRTLLVAGLLGGSAQAAEVTSTADAGPGSLRAAIEAVNLDGGGTITFADPFPPEGVIVLASSLPAFTAASVEVQGGDKEPRIDGGDQHRLFKAAVSNSELVLSDLILRRGRAGSDEGGCIDGDGTLSGSLSVTRVAFRECVVEQDSLAFGGAIRWDRGSGLVSISDSVFEQNAAIATLANGQASGGAVYVQANLEVNRSIFLANVASAPNGANAAGSGAAIRASGGFSSISDSRFELNSNFPAGGFALGGAILLACTDCFMQIGRSSFNANASINGGAIAARADAPGELPILSVVNSSFLDNSVSGNGGALHLDFALLSARNNSFYRNDAAGGSHLWFAPGSGVDVFGANLLAPPFSGDACGFDVNGFPNAIIGQNYLSDASCGPLEAGALPAGPLGTIRLDETPGLVPVLQFSGSGVIDSIAASAGCEPLDARGTARPVDGDEDGEARCDVGAYEDPGPAIFASGFES